MILSSPVVLWGQLALAGLGAAIALAALVDASTTWRLLRVLGLNGVRRILTTGDIVEEACALALHLVVLGASALMVTRADQPPWPTRLTLILVILLAAGRSLVRLTIRHRVLATLNPPGRHW